MEVNNFLRYVLTIGIIMVVLGTIVIIWSILNQTLNLQICQEQISMSAKKVWRPFEEAREFVRSLKLRNQTEWKEYLESGERPNDIPSSPDSNYKNNGWINWGDWLGTGSIATKNRVYLSFKEAREFARSLKLNAQREWFQYAKTDEKPDEIPADPTDDYKNDGWKDWIDWLGNEDRIVSEETKRKMSEAAKGRKKPL